MGEHPLDARRMGGRVIYELPTHYVIDVCRTCGALARWPFACGHRPKGWVQSDAPSWTVPLRVHPTEADRRWLAEQMAQNWRPA